MKNLKIALLALTLISPASAKLAVSTDTIQEQSIFDQVSGTYADPQLLQRLDIGYSDPCDFDRD